jgi:hypothetical protein
MGILRCRVLLSAPLPRVWEFIIDPRNLHHWLPLTEKALRRLEESITRERQ